MWIVCCGVATSNTKQSKLCGMSSSNEQKNCETPQTINAEATDKNKTKNYTFCSNWKCLEHVIFQSTYTILFLCFAYKTIASKKFCESFTLIKTYAQISKLVFHKTLHTK